MPKEKIRRKSLPNSTSARRRNRRAVFIGVVFCLLFGLLLYEIWYIQTVHGEDYSRRASAWIIDRVDHLSPPIVPNRGWIADRNMQPLAFSHPVYNVVLDRTMLAYRENLAIQRNTRLWMDDTLDALHEALGIPMHELRALFVRDADDAWQSVIRDNWYIVAREIPANIALPLRDEFRDIYVEEISFRVYPDPFLAPQVLGFLRGDAQWGLEGRYHTMLTGTAGRVFRAFGTDNTPTREETPVRHGMNLVTTLDSDIQRLAQETVDHTFATVPSDAVALLVMDPFTGEILAMAQAPNFSLAAPDDPSLFTDPSISAAWPFMTAEEQTNAWFNIWRNYHTTRSFEPGSVFKPIVIAAALEEGILSPHDVFFCNGSHLVGDVSIRCFGGFAHGSINVSEVIEVSCNVAMIQIMQRLGANQFYRYRGYFGYGERTGIDLPGEESVSSPLVMYALNQLGPVQLATSSIGQGFNNTTLQAAASFAALINGGNLMRPYIVSHVIDASGAVVQENRPQIIRSVISQSTSDWLRREMEQVVIGSRGTGRQTRIPGHTIGAKTGTAERGAAREDVSLAYWVYTPVENPEYLILAVIDNVVETNRTAGNTLAPIIRVFLEDLILLKNLPPSEGTHTEDLQSPVLGLEPMPDFVGDRVVDVVRNLINRGIAFEVHGGGTIVSSHLPAAAPGRPLPQPNSIPVHLHTDPTTRVEGAMTFMPNVEGLNAEQAHEFIRDNLLIPIPFGGEGERANNEVYKQYPAAGTEVPQGMQVMIRVRPK
ncbi:MAG: penicillin-binding transpeptidase domain-containing protein [Defluviitaleaceae bacterium]|nr:penicillin-binding transpeptidase domain-containing protein [Defluviitaleaceae bacterium]